jgi:hypothetical protein
MNELPFSPENRILVKSISFLFNNYPELLFHIFKSNGILYSLVFWNLRFRMEIYYRNGLNDK